MNVRVFAGAYVACLACSCSSPDGRLSSHAKDITVAQSDGRETLYWIDNGQISEGTCDPQAVPQRTVCQQNLTTNPLADVTTRAAAAIDAQAATATQSQAAETKRLKDADPTIQALASQVAALTAQAPALAQKIAGETQHLAQDTAAKSAKDQDLAWYDAQIKDLDAKLAQTPDDRDLRRLREQDQTDRDAAAATSASLAQVIATLSSELAQDQASQTKAAADLQALKATYAQAYAALVVQSPTLDQLAATLAELGDAKAALASVTSKIAQADLVYRAGLLTADEAAALAFLGQAMAPQFALKAGSYTDVSGDTSYCPQGVAPAGGAGNTTMLAVTFLSPCNAAASLTCDAKGLCTGAIDSDHLTLTVTDFTHYDFTASESGTVGHFAFQAAGFLPATTPYTTSTRVAK